MIKLGIFGDQTTNHEVLGRLKKMPEVEPVGVYFSGNGNVPGGFAEFASPNELMDCSDAILFLSDKSISNDLVRLILRKSKHIYLKTIPNLQVREIKELIDLEKEAGIVTFIYNPFNYVAHFNPYSTKYEKPFLINLRTCFEVSSIKQSHELLLLVTALNRLVQSNCKKVDVFGLLEKGSNLILNLRTEYDNGCVINLTLSHEKMPGYCEIFDQKESTKFEYKQPLYVMYPHLNQEFESIVNFVRLIQNQEKKENSFDNLLNGVQTVHEIKEHLRFSGIDF